MKIPSIRTALITAVIVALGAFVLLRIGDATAQSGCIQPIPDSGTVTGTWNADCLSENIPTEPTNPPSGTRYARFYTFTVSEDADITIDLNSSTDTYMFLMEGTGTNGAVLHENDDIVRGSNANSRISESLSAGDYTIEATTYEVETAGDFTLTVSGLPDVSTPTATPTIDAGDTPTVTPTPTAPATPTATPTPAPTTVPTDVLNRLAALETLVATQQGLISTLESKITALDSRVAVLEAGVPSPTPPPTKTPTATPTTVSTPTATTTPVTAATPEPTATPTNTVTPAATASPEPVVTNTPTPRPTATNTPTPTATATPEPTVTNTPTPRPTPVGAFTGRGIFQEIDRLGANEFNSSYSEKYIEISAYWGGVIDTDGIFRNYYGVATIEEPSDELVFIGNIFFGNWHYSYTEPHDGKIIVGAGAGSIFASRRTYICKVDE